MNSLRGPGWSPAGDVSAGLFHQYNGSWRLPPPGHLSQVRGSTARCLNLKLSVFIASVTLWQPKQIVHFWRVWGIFPHKMVVVVG